MRPADERVSPGRAAGGAAAAPAHTSAAGARERSASPPRAVSPESAALPGGGLEEKGKPQLKFGFMSQKLALEGLIITHQCKI